MTRAYGKPTEAQLRNINKLAKTSLTADEVFVFTDKMIGDGLIPDRYHRMKKSSLSNFRNEAKAGVSFLLDHSWSGFAPPKAALPYGKTFDAVLRKLQPDEIVGDETQAVFAEHYIPRDLEIDGISTDAIIRQIETGILSDTSIGWYGGKFVCSICGGNYLRYSECQHFAGREYDGIACEVHIEDAHLMENSGVFDGAYPGAGILSSGGGQQAGELVMVGDAELKQIGDGDLTTRIFGTYSAKSGLNLYVARGAVSVNSQTQKLNKTQKESQAQKESQSQNKGTQRKEEDNLDPQIQELQTKITDLTNQLTQANAALTAETSAKDALQAQVTTLQTDLDTQKAEIASLQPLAEDGKAFKAYMIGEAHKWGVKAMGNAYKKELHEKIFSSLTVAEITEFKDGFEAKAREELGTGRISYQNNPGEGTDHSLRGNSNAPDPDNEKAFREAQAVLAKKLMVEGKAKTIKEAAKMAGAELLAQRNGQAIQGKEAK